MYKVRSSIYKVTTLSLTFNLQNVIYVQGDIFEQRLVHNEVVSATGDTFSLTFNLQQVIYVQSDIFEQRLVHNEVVSATAWNSQQLHVDFTCNQRQMLVLVTAILKRSAII